MPKSKKKKNKDFQKVKLKVGKRLPKADNETRTSFKAATIHVPHQLKETGSEPTTKRKLSLMDLFSQLQHYSASVRHSAVIGLRELINANSAILLSNLSGIVCKLSELFVDKDSAVRQAVIRLLHLLLPQLSTNQISPFFSVINAHLCCAMTHIFEDICLDSLPLLDVFFENFPILVTKNSGAMLQNFMEQISNPKKPGRNESGRSLSLNPTRKMSSLKWRVGVLERLQKFLSAMSISEDVHIPALKGDNSHVRYVDIEGKGQQPFSPGCQRLQTSYSYLLSSNRADTLSSSGKIELKSFVNHLLPLLLECWVEAVTSDNKGHNSLPDGLVSPESLVVMANVVKVIQLLWKYLQINNDEPVGFPNDFSKDFKEQLMGNFPYSVHEVAARKDKKNTSVSKDKETVLSLNLAVCDIMTYLESDMTNGIKSSEGSREPISNFLLSALRGERLSQDNLLCTIRVVRQYLSNGDLDEAQKEIIECCYSIYLNAHPMSFEKRSLLEFLSELTLNLNFQLIAVNNPILDRFLLELPSLLCDYSSRHQMAAFILQVLAEAQIQGKLSISHKDLMSFLDPEKGVLLSLSDENQLKLLEILYRVDLLDGELLKAVSIIINTDSISAELSSFLIESLSLRFVSDLRKPGNSLCDIGTYLSFLTTIMIGVNREDLSNTDTNLGPNLGGHTISCSEENLAKWNRNQTITTACISASLQLPETAQVWLALEAFLQNILVQQTSWKSHSVLALLECVNKLHIEAQPISIQLTEALVHISLSLLHSIYAFAVEITNPETLVQCENFTSCVWKTVSKLLSSHDHGLKICLVAFQHGFQSKPLQERKSAVLLLTSIVKDLGLLSQTDVDLVLLRNVSEDVLGSSEYVDKQLLVDLKYHLSLILKGDLILDT